jgi:hypothetical protein
MLHADKKRTDGQSDMTKLIVACRNFAKTLKMYLKRNRYGNRGFD